MVEMKARLESAQHILYRLLQDRYGARSTGIQISNTKIRLDVRCSTNLLETPQDELEREVNGIIARDLVVMKKIYKTGDVPNGVDLKSVPTGVDEVRVVSIGDFDTQPCINPHVDRTSEIGRWEILDRKKKGRDVYRIVSTVQ